MSNNAPCKDCQDRHLGCHSECESYKEFRRLSDERSEIIRKNKMLVGLLYGYNPHKKEKSNLSHHEYKNIYKKEK